MAIKTAATGPEIDPATGLPVVPAGGWTLGNGSQFVMPTFENMPKGSFGYANLADQMIDAQKMIDAGPGRFNGNTAGRYAFGGGNYGSDNPLAAKGQGLLAFGNGGGGPGGYNPFAGRGNGGLLGPPPGSPPGTTPPGAGGPPGAPPPAGPPAAPPPVAPPAVPPPTIKPPPSPYNQPPPVGVPFPGFEQNFGTPPKALNTPTNAMLAMAGNGAGLLGAAGGNQAQANQMTNAYNVGGQSYRPWLNALATQGLTEPKSGAMAEQWASEGLGKVVNGKWEWAPGKGWDSATSSVY